MTLVEFRSACPRPCARLFGLAGALSIVAACATAAPEPAPRPTTTMPAGADPRASLRAGLRDAGEAARNMELVAHRERPGAFNNPSDPGDILFANSDLAFQGNSLFLGSFHGIQIWDISDPRNPRMRTSLPCPGGQGDLSVYRNLLFMSVEMPNGRVDCGQGEFNERPSRERFLGVRIFDISDLARPRQVAAVQTCRGSHTHTLVTDPRDAAHVYIYVSGTFGVRPPSELAGCSAGGPQDPNTARFRIEVIRVPLAAPQNASIVNMPRIFADPQTGSIAGLWRGGTHGPGTQETAMTDQCHDITVFPAIGLAAGACSGNGILLNIAEPANPRRIDEVTDPNFAYWHSATFNHDGSKVLFTDEWGGGMAAHCRRSDKREWGADAIFDIADRKMRHRGYYKLPVAQTATENCVAHNGSLIPVPGRDIMVQAWYQGGVSVFDFTDSANPVEIAFFDRGPLSASSLHLGGFWSAYWYNGHIYGSEMGRGLDVFRLTASEQLSQNEIDAANLVRFEELNPQTQPKLVWPAHFVVARAYLDQLRRGNHVPADRLTRIAGELDRLERLQDAAARRTGLNQLATTVTQLEGESRSAAADARRLGLLAQTVRDLANAPR
jgi:hypothetical protein